jgi:hypothetical protein
MHFLLLYHGYDRKEFHLLLGPDMAISGEHNIWSWPIHIGLQIWKTFARYAAFPNVYRLDFRFS